MIVGAFYGLKMFDWVFVNGHGMGRIVDMHKSEWPSTDWIKVEQKNRRKCERCGVVHECIEYVTIHPQHVSNVSKKHE